MKVPSPGVDQSTETAFETVASLIEYELPWQTGAFAPGFTMGEGMTVRAKGGEMVPEPQAFVPWTVILPLTAPAEKSTVMLGEFAPATIVAPVGTVHE